MAIQPLSLSLHSYRRDLLEARIHKRRLSAPRLCFKFNQILSRPWW